MKKTLKKLTKKLQKIIPGLVLFSMAITPVQAGIFEWLAKSYTVSPSGSGNSTLFADSRFGMSGITKLGSVKNSEFFTSHGGFVLGPNIAAKESESEKFREMVIPATAYSSTPDQTDDTPFITARGTYVRDGIVAANFLPFGTKIKIPEIYGDKIFIVEDRMNRRYWHKIDIWFPDRQSALEFGLRTVKIQIIES